MAAKVEPFWKRKTLAELDSAEWESLCDGCGLCCLQKLEDEEDGAVYYTRIACRLLDLKTCQCSDYPNRRASVPDCIQLNAQDAAQFKWLPPTCAYRPWPSARPAALAPSGLWRPRGGTRRAHFPGRQDARRRQRCRGALGRPPDFPCWLNLSADCIVSRSAHLALSDSVEFSSMLARLLSLFALVLFIVGPAQAAKRVDLDYHVRFLPAEDQAVVQLILEKGEAVRSLQFNPGDEGYYSDFRADGEWQQESPALGTWRPAPGKATLSYRVRISHPRDNGRFDARMTPDWALFRGDDLVPPARLDQVDGVSLVSRISFELPEGWKSIETGWPRIGKNRFRVDNRERLFDRPTGWMLAGKLGTRRAKLGETEVTVAAPVGEGVRRMDILTMLTFVWPQVQNVFPRDPAKLLIVGAGDPMWRGGLSDPIPVHACRPPAGQRERHKLAGA